MSHEFFLDRIKQVEDPVVIDVGANVGLFALQCPSTVWAFEPNPIAYSVIADEARDSMVTCRCAVSDKAGKGILNVPVDDSKHAISTLGTPREERQELGWKQIEVDTVALDDFTFTKVDFIKIDTEGNELNVLLGAERLIRRDKPELLVEYTSLNTRQFGYEREEIVAVLKEWGYNEFREVGHEDLWARVNNLPGERGLKFLVAGTPGCGTLSTAMAFQHAGFSSGHEKAFNFSGVYPDINTFWGHLEMESSWMSGHHLPRFTQESPDTLIIHLIRHPFRVTESVYDSGMFYGAHLGGYVLFAHNALQSLHNYPDPWDKTAHFIIEWNKMIEPYAHLRHKIEDGIPALMDKLEIEFDGENEKYHASNKEHPKLRRGMIHNDLWSGLLKQTEEYGYERA